MASHIPLSLMSLTLSLSESLLISSVTTSPPPPLCHQQSVVVTGLPRVISAHTGIVVTPRLSSNSYFSTFQIRRCYYFVSSVRSSSGYHGLLHIRSTHFFKFFKFFRFESERTQHVLYFWKAWDSRISNMTFLCIKCKIHKYTITQIRKYTNTKCLKDPTCAIFFKSMGFKDI